ncbi:MAG TPA: hypothetical protein DCZ91_19190 [Lachnospiraceae bacterium]|nr:hypothetical protein [Lachnospiraceae bacterium]
MEQAEQILKEIIDKEGVDYLRKSACAVYHKLEGKVAPLLSRLILITLLADIPVKAKERSVSDLSKEIQKQCCLKKGISDQLAVMYVSLFNKENLAEWKEKNGQGFREFCSRRWQFEWSGEGVWNTGNAHADCYCSVTAEIEAVDAMIIKEEISKQLKANPFMTSEKIFQYYYNCLSKVLDADFEEYVTCDDYYPPVMEDYHLNCEDALTKICDEKGFKVVSFTCDGGMSDFEPNRSGWY